MAKIENQSGLVLDTNLFLHIQEVEDTDIAVDATGHTLIQAAGDFEATSSVGGIEGSGFAVGDLIEVNSEGNGFLATITTIVALQIDYTFVSGTEVTESSGGTINVQRTSKFIEYQEASGLSFVDGVEATALHSKMQTLWKDSDLDKYDPLSGSIEPRAKSLYFLNYWDFYNINTQKAHRGGAVQVQVSKASAVKKIYAHITAPTTVDTTDQWNFWNREDAQTVATTLAVTTGYMDEIELILDVDNTIDKRGYWLVRCAEQSKTIAMQQIQLLYAETVGVTVANAIDPILYNSGSPVADATILAGGIYANIDVAKNEVVSIARNFDGFDGASAIVAVGANITVVDFAGGAVDEKSRGTVTLTGLPSDGDTISIDDGVNTAVVFEFDNNSSVTNDNTPLSIEATIEETLAAFANTVNDQTLAGNLLIIAGQGVHAQLVEGTSYPFAYDVEYDSKDYEVTHTKLNWLLRQDESTNINQDVTTAPYLTGEKQWPISEFVGATQTLDGFPLTYSESNSNDMDLLDQSNTIREFNTIASYTIVVPQSFIDGTPNPQITIYVADTHGGANAAIVTNSAAAQQKDVVLSAAETAISFAYSTFNLGGHTPNTPLPIAISINQPGVAEAELFFGNTIEANTTQRFQLAPSVDPSYIA